MGNKCIFKIEIGDDIENDIWYSGLNGYEFYAVKTKYDGGLVWEIINEPELNGNFILYKDASILELITKVIMP